MGQAGWNVCLHILAQQMGIRPVAKGLKSSVEYRTSLFSQIIPKVNINPLQTNIKFTCETCDQLIKMEAWKESRALRVAPHYALLRLKW